MPSLTKSREAILEKVLALIWRQWTLLGVPGELLNLEVSGPIIDPEALLLVTSEIGRFDARLFDECMNWLRHYGKLINLQRLGGMLKSHALGNPQVLAAIAYTIQINSRNAKWRSIQSFGHEMVEAKSLFLNLDGDDSPQFGKPDLQFQKFGLFRGIYRSREDIVPPRIEYPELLLIKLRSLFGVNARVEIIAALLTHRVAHPSALARLISYLPRSLQEILNEMALSGHIATSRVKGGREKYFSLKPEEWSFLLTWPDRRIPAWISWNLIFSLLQEVVKVLYSAELQKASDLMIAMRLREVYERHNPKLREAGFAGYFPDSDRESGRKFTETFLTEIGAIPLLNPKQW